MRLLSFAALAVAVAVAGCGGKTSSSPTKSTERHGHHKSEPHY